MNVEHEPLDEAACKHNLALVKSLQYCRPVIYQGQERFLQVINSSLNGGRIEVEVWLTGSAERVDPAQITVPKTTEKR